MRVSLDSPLTAHVGKAAARRLEKCGLLTVRDLVEYSPRRYYKWGKLSDISKLQVGEDATVLVQVKKQNLLRNRSGRGVRLLVDVTDGASSLTCTFFAKNPYMLSPHQRLLKPGATVLMAGKLGEYRGNLQMVQPEFEELEEGSRVVAERRAGRPIPIYRSCGGLSSWKIGALISGLLDRVQLDDADDPLPEDVKGEHGLIGYGDALMRLHRPASDVDWQEAKRSLAWMEAFVLQAALLARKERRRSHNAIPIKPDTENQVADQLVENLPFTLTAAQRQAWQQIETDIQDPSPMQRLLQADVGAGKTIIALLAMAQTVGAGYQAALLAPTEVLARQHYVSITRMLDGAGLQIPVHLVTASRPAAEKTAALGALASGEPSIAIGTHALLSEGVQIPDLAMLVVDEQHRFGVTQRDQLREQADHTPHTLVMTATPIPRTIAMAVFGDLDVTTMDELPPGRQPVETHLVNSANTVWMQRTWQRAKEEVDEGGRVFVVCPRIEVQDEDEEDTPALPLGVNVEPGASASRYPAATVVHEELLEKPIFKGLQIGLAHGAAKPEENAETFRRFQTGDAPILVATTVVEVGVDVPEATMMVVLGADRFGLSTLHQLRGRVGRSDRPSVALLVSAPNDNPTTAERLAAIEGTTDGFVLAEADLRLRSEGDVLGRDQAGNVSGLRFLSVTSDGPVIEAAREAAAKVLGEDPRLERHASLVSAVNGRLGEDVVWLERS